MAGMETGCIFPFEWPRASLKRWLVGLGIWAAIAFVLYLIFSLWTGW